MLNLRTEINMTDTKSFKEYVKGMLNDKKLSNDTRIRLLKGWIEKLVEDMVTLIQDSEDICKRQEWKEYLEEQLQEIIK